MLLLGKPIIGQRLLNNAENLLKNPYFSEQFAFDDPESIVQEIVKLIRDPERQRILGESNARIFDSELSPKATVSEILNNL